MNYTWILIGSYSIGLAAAIGLIRFRRIARTYQPFVFLTLAAFCQELVSTILIRSGRSNAPGIHILDLTESLLWLWQFRNWGAFSRTPRRAWQLGLFFLLFWLTENLAFGKLFVFSSYFSLLFSWTVVMLAITQVNKLLLVERGSLLLNARFLISTGALIFYSYRIMVESFYLFELSERDVFLTNVFKILVFVNLFVNLLFAFATIWIPKRQKFTLPY